ncbi:SMC-Scp complex subunit ScpB [bacterium]|nr:SMC-Scp complex subunit ScpB [bacterium]
MEVKEIKAVIECMLFVSDKPMSLGTIQGMLEEVDRRTVLVCLDELKAEYDMQGRAFHLAEIAEGYQLATRVQYAPWIRKMFKSRTSNKLSRAALETLAIIAYRQPVTKAEIEDVRGVSADGMVNTLLDRKFIRIVGRKEVVGRPILYGTTKEFLHYFGLKDLTDMPMLKDLQDILDSDEAGKAWEINPQGELVAKVKVGEEGEANEPYSEDGQSSAQQMDDAGENQAKAVGAQKENQEAEPKPETLDEGGNVKPDAKLEMDTDTDADDDADDEDGDEDDDEDGHSNAGDVVSAQMPETTASMDQESEPVTDADDGKEDSFNSNN